MLFKTNTIIGHRGCREVAQNNTIEAFMKARALGAEMVEMDVRRTRDGVLIVWHDATIEDWRTRAHTYEELAGKANSLGMVLPRLEEVVKALEGKMMLCVELKEAGYEEEVVSLLLKYFGPSEFVMISFLDVAVKAVKRGFPTVRTGLIVGEAPAGMGAWGRFVHKMSVIFPWKRLQDCQADFLVVGWKLLFYGVAERARRRGIPMIVWVVDEPKMAVQLMRSRLFIGVISNNPGALVKLRRDL